MTIFDNDYQLLKTDARPRLCLRIGVTGHRDLAGRANEIEDSVRTILDRIEQAVQSQIQNNFIRKLYADAPPLFQLASSLAEGADRIVARLALARGWKLVAPLPFARSDYETDFPQTIAEFRGLLSDLAVAGGEIVELDGTRQKETASYYGAGRFIVEHSDLLVAVWDGKPAKGEGGTAQIVAEACGADVPVLQVQADRPHSLAILKTRDFGVRSTAISQDWHEITELVGKVIAPHWSKALDAESQAQRKSAQKYLTNEPVKVKEGTLNSLDDGPFEAPPALLSRVFPLFIKCISGSQSVSGHSAKARSPSADHPSIRGLHLYFHRADVLATHYSQIHRSAFVVIYLLGSLALAAAATTQLLNDHTFAGFRLATISTGLELISLIGILGLVFAEKRLRWRERWLDYRLLAEILRQTDLLAQARSTLSSQKVCRIGEDQPNRFWVCWLAMSVSRAAGVVGIQYDTAHLEQVRNYTVEVRLADQIEYHIHAEKRNSVVSHRLRLLSEGLFFCTLAVVIIELVFSAQAHVVHASFLASFFPAIAAASFGIRNQAEFEIVVRRSARLGRQLQRQRDVINLLRGDILTSERLGREISQVAEIMRDDTAEWSAIFDVKESETA
jgi:hypothetical protein